MTSVNRRGLFLLGLPAPFTSFDPLTAYLRGIPVDVPSGLLQLAAAVRARTDLPVEVMDLSRMPRTVRSGEIEDFREFQEQLEVELRPCVERFRIFGIAVVGSQSFLSALAVARALRRLDPSCRVIVGGQAVTTSPRDYAFEGSPFHHVVVGEADLELPRLVLRLEREPALGDGPSEVIRAEPPRLDDVPPIDWSLYPVDDLATDSAFDIGTFSSRGCPFECPFCGKAIDGWRGFSPGRVVEDARRLADHFAGRSVYEWIYDPTWGFEKAWRRRMFEAWLGDPVRWPTWIESRVELLSDEDLHQLGRHGVQISFGLESGSPTMLRIMRKTSHPGPYLSRMREIAAVCEADGTYWRVSVMLGFPGETAATIAETRAYLDRLLDGTRRGFPNFKVFTPYPGTDVDRRMDWYGARYGAEFLSSMWHYYPYEFNWYQTRVVTRPSASLGTAELMESMLDWGQDLFGRLESNLVFDPRRMNREVLGMFRATRATAKDPALLAALTSSLERDEADALLRSFWRECFPEIELERTPFACGGREGGP